MCENQKFTKEFYETKVKNLMQTDKAKLPCVDETTEVGSLLPILETNDHVWVMDRTDSTQLIGIITRSDTIAFFSPPLASTSSFDNPDPRSFQFGERLSAADIMSKKPVTAAPENTLRDIIQKMKEQKIKHFAIVNEYGLLIGEVSLQMIIKRFLIHFSDTNKKEKILST